MLEKVAVAILSSEWFMLAVVGIGVRLLAGWFMSATGLKWKRFEGWAVTAVKAAEKAIPDNTPNKGLARFDKAMLTFLAKYRDATGTEPNKEALAAIENLLNEVHAKLEGNGQL